MRTLTCGVRGVLTDVRLARSLLYVPLEYRGAAIIQTATLFLNVCFWDPKELRCLCLPSVIKPPPLEQIPVSKKAGAILAKAWRPLSPSNAISFEFVAATRRSVTVLYMYERQLTAQ